MTKLNIRADQVCVGDILSDGYEILDFDIVGDYVDMVVGKSFEDEHNWRIARDATMTVDTDYLDRIFSEWDAEDVNVDVEDVPDVDFGEDVEDLLDH